MTTKFERPRTVVQYVLEGRRQGIIECMNELLKIQNEHSFTNVDDEAVFNSGIQKISRLIGGN